LIVLKEEGEKKKMKRKTLLCLTSVALMFLGVFMIGLVGAQPTWTIGVEPSSKIDPGLGPGSTFTVEIWVRNVTDLVGVEFKLGYNKTVLNATSITYGGVFGPPGDYFPLISAIYYDAGYLHYSIMEMFGQPGFTGDGRAATINFTVLSFGESVLDLYDTILGIESGAMPHDVLDGYFSNIHKWLDYQGSLLPPGDPSDPPTTWHELYPEYCSTWSLTSWQDTGGDGKLSISDIIDMTPITPPGPVQWFHVEEVTVTLYAEGIKGSKLDIYIELEGGWPDYDVPLPDPVSTYWHEIYPTFSNRYHVDDWNDKDGSGTVTPGDEVTLTDQAPGGATTQHNVVEVSTDIIIKPITPPIAEFPLGLAMEISLIAAIAYIWLRNRRKIKPIKTI